MSCCIMSSASQNFQLGYCLRLLIKCLLHSFTVDAVNNHCLLKKIPTKHIYALRAERRIF